MRNDGNSYYSEAVPAEYRKVKVGVKNLDDAVLNLGSIKQALGPHGYTNKAVVFKALADHDLQELRNISNFYYNINGIYQRACNYFAFLYRYDWYVATQTFGNKDVNEEKVLKDFTRILEFLDSSNIRKMCGDIALSVIKDGAYYGYIVPNSDSLVIQQLPVGYCRSRYKVKDKHAIEFNMKFFDTFKDPVYRLRILKLFPEEFQKGYILYKQGKLLPDSAQDRNDSGWYLLDPESTIKFNFNDSDIPMFVNAIPALLDLDAAQDLDRRKQMQKLLKIIIQKLPMDKNGDLIFDIDEAKDIHNNAVEMLRRAVGVDVLTTFADIDSVDMSDKNTSTTVDDLEKVERAVFNSLGISQNLFNTDGNLSLERSILNDESSVRNLLLQFNIFFDRVVRAISPKSKQYKFEFYMLETTQYNYQNLSKLYKEQTQLGFSKLLPQIALGHSQSFILNSIYFENDILHLSEVMIPPLMSSTLNGNDILGKNEKGNTNKTQNKAMTNTDKSAGRPEKADSEKSTKTIQNKESMN